MNAIRLTIGDSAKEDAMKNFKSEMCYSVNTKLFLIFYFLSLVLFNSGSYCAWAKAPETPKILFTSWRDGNGEIYTMNPDGSEQVRLTWHRANDTSAVWSPTGDQILFVSDRDEGFPDLFLMDADGANVQKIFDRSVRRSHPTFSADGKEIAYLEYFHEAVYKATIDGEKERRIVRVNKYGGDPDWSPTGAEIVFIFADWLDRKLSVLNLKTNKRDIFKLFNPAGGARPLRPNYAAWAPSGDKIAFSTLPPDVDLADQGTIYILNRDGTGIKQIVSKKGLRAYLPVWSPDGNALAYTQGIDKTQQIFKIDIDSRVVKQLTHHGNNQASDWFDPAFALPVQPQPYLLTTTWGKLKQK